MLYIGIDVAKRSHVAAAMGDGGEVAVEPFEFRNTQKGFERLLERLAGRGVSAEGSLVGMGATGHYWVALFDFLAANGFEVAVINPIQTDAWRKVDTVRPAKTDGIDALLIADPLRCKRFEPSALGDEATEGLGQLARYRFELVQELTALKNRATAILDRVFPEHERLFADKFGPTSSALLRECATPADVLAADPEALAGLLVEASRGRLGRERADEVVEALGRRVVRSTRARLRAQGPRRAHGVHPRADLGARGGDRPRAARDRRQAPDEHTGRRAHARRAHRRGGRRRQPLRDALQARGLRRHGRDQARLGREPRQPRAPLQARLALPQVGAHAGRRPGKEVRPVLRGVLRAQDLAGQAPLRGPHDGRPQARRRLPRPHEGGQGLVARAAGRASPRSPLAEGVTVRALCPISGFQGSYQKSPELPLTPNSRSLVAVRYDLA